MDEYILSTKMDEYNGLVLANPQDWAVFGRFNGQSLSEMWKPVRVRVDLVEKTGDFPSFASHIPVFSERAWNILRSLIGDHVEALPLDSPLGRFLAINVTRVVDCLDEERSGILRFPDGRIMDVESYILKEGCLQGEPIFKIRGTELMDVLVSDTFKNQVEQNELQGAEFIPAHQQRRGGDEKLT